MNELTFADMNPEIRKNVVYIRKMADAVLEEMYCPECEGCAVLEGLLEIQTAINTAVARYRDEEDTETPW